RQFVAGVIFRTRGSRQAQIEIPSPLALGSLDLRLAPQTRASETVVPPARPPPAARARGIRKANPARIRLFSLSRSRAGTPRRPRNKLPSPRPLLGKKLRPGYALSLRLPDENPTD